MIKIAIIIALLLCMPQLARGLSAPPAVVERVVEEWLEFALGPTFGVPGAIVYIATPYWEGTWTEGTADLGTGRPISATDTFRIASISKTFTATVVLQLVDEGVLRLEDTLDRFDDGFGVPESHLITVQQLLNHTSGMADWDASTAALHNLCAVRPPEVPQIGYTPREMVDMAVSMGTLWPPGCGWQYSDTNYILLGMVVEWALQSAVTGTRLPREIRERILVPLSLDHTTYPEDSSMPGQPVHGYWIPAQITDDQGKPLCPSWGEYTGPVDGTAYNPSKEFGCGAMISTLEDLKTWCTALVHGTMINGVSHREQLQWGPFPASSGGYGLGVMSVGGLIGHGGDFSIGYSSGMYYLPSRQAVIIVLLNSESFNATYLAALLSETIFPPQPTPRPASGDYNGDGRADPVIFRRPTGLWAVRELGRTYFGGRQDIPVPGDYDGDGYADVAIFRPVTGLWAIRGVSRLYFGDWQETPVPGDYDGNGSCDIAVFHDITGRWKVRAVTEFFFGTQFDRPVPGDFDGDGVVEAAVFRPSTVISPSAGLWAIRGSTRFYFGAGGDIPVPAVYDWYGSPSRLTGPFKSETAVFRPSSGLWAVRGGNRHYFGTSGDIPQLADYDGNGLTEMAIYRPAAGLWAVREYTRFYFGSYPDIMTRYQQAVSGDQPLSR